MPDRNQQSRWTFWVVGLFMLVTTVAGCTADNLLGLGHGNRGIGSSLGDATPMATDDARTTPAPDSNTGIFKVVYYYGLSYVPEKNRVAVSGDGGVMLFDAVDGRKIKTIDPGTGLAVLVRQTSNVIAATQIGNLWLFDASGDLTRTIPHEYQIYSMDLSQDGGTIITGDVAGRVRRFATTTGKEIFPAVVSGTTAFINDVRISPDGLYFAAASLSSVRIWRTVDAALAREIKIAATHFVFSPDSSELLVSGSSAGQSFSVATGALIRSYGSDAWVARCAYSGDGTRVALSLMGGTVVTVFDRASGAELLSLFDASEPHLPEQPGFRDVSEMAFTQQDTHLVAAWRSGRLANWRLSDGVLEWSYLDNGSP